MPIIQVKYATPAPVAADIRQQIASRVAKMTTELLGKNANLIAITVEAVRPEDWFVAGASLAERKQASFFLDIKVTDGTNTKDEKASFIAAVFAAMGALLGPLHSESYVHVHDVRAEAYGYGGLTQEWRYVAAKFETAERQDKALAAVRSIGVR